MNGGGGDLIGGRHRVGGTRTRVTKQETGGHTFFEICAKQSREEEAKEPTILERKQLGKKCVTGSREVLSLAMGSGYATGCQ